ncbi:hypothetical protein B0T10DRAFT_551364 [Thelonectria olida]|uniref:NB-ARC domain-containing protein n=1 Tax=Thelonectria olida TaxID=1576542 RepID=A0A9P9ALI9_9HYPO|nr:hypothetical protein B0T10DRAFT_551364 [Thelonectria olida]
MTQAGLHVIFDSNHHGQPRSVAEVDVVAVHGLNFKNNPNHARQTWMMGDKLWLKDFFPGSLPQATRVMLFAYNSSPSLDATAIRLDDHAKNLLQWLHLERQDALQRPLVFICHSLGGLVVKEALVEATLDVSYKSIVEATRLLVFFATPHQGGNYASVGDVAAKIVSAGLLKPSNDLLDALKQHSNEATRRFEQSRHLYERCLVVSFFEGMPYGKMGIIVDKKSATLNLPGTREKQVAMHADHSAICKFESADSLAGRLILGTIATEIKRALEMDRNTDRSPFRVPFSLQGVPASDNFIDRPSDTAELERCILPRRSHTQQIQLRKIFVLYGLGGVGKTQLAIHFARRHQATFSSVFWLDGRSEDRLKRSIAGCIDRIPEGQIPTASRKQAEAHSEDDLNAAVTNVMEWLARSDNGDWLLIFDNVDHDHEQGGATGAYDLRQYLPGDHGSVLVTTRLSRLAQLGESRQLAKADPVLGRAILEKWYGGELGSDCDQLLELLDGLPLALAQSASYLREKGIGVAIYMQIYQQQWDELMGSHGASHRPLLDYQQGSIATTWTVSFREIESRSTNAANLLRLWAFLDNKQLWHGLLAPAAEPADQWPEWLRDLACNTVRFFEAIGLLLRYSMIETREGSEGSYSMHPVVHRWASYLEGNQQKNESARLALMIIGFSVPVKETREYWVLQQKLLPHAERCVGWVREAAEGTWDSGDESAIASLHMLGILYSDQGKFKEAEEMYEWALEGHEKVLGRDHTSTLAAVGNLGNLYRDQGKFKEAEEMYERALEDYEKVLGRDHTSTLNTVNNLGILYKDQGKFKEAEEMYERALEGKEKVLGRDHTSTLATVGNLGILYKDQGKFKEAEEMYERALEGYEKALGRDHTSTLNSIHCLGNLYEDQDKLKEAEEMYERALEGYEKALGRDHTSTLNTVNHLGTLYSKQGKSKEAEEIYGRVLEGYEKVLGRDHTSTLNTVNNLGILYKDQGKFKEAEEMYERALEGYEKAFGRDHTSTLDTVNNLGSLYKDQGKFKEAEEMYERALHGFQTALGPGHPKSFIVMRNIESLRLIQGMATPHSLLSTEGILTGSANMSMDPTEEAEPGRQKGLGRLAARIRRMIKSRRADGQNDST